MPSDQRNPLFHMTKVSPPGRHTQVAGQFSVYRRVVFTRDLSLTIPPSLCQPLAVNNPFN
jgi:hypothetical protein